MGQHKHEKPADYRATPILRARMLHVPKDLDEEIKALYAMIEEGMAKDGKRPPPLDTFYLNLLAYGLSAWYKEIEEKRKAAALVVEPSALPLP